MTLSLITNPSTCVVLPKGTKIKEVTYRGEEKTFRIANASVIEKELETLKMRKVSDETYTTSAQIAMCCE